LWTAKQYTFLKKDIWVVGGEGDTTTLFCAEHLKGLLVGGAFSLYGARQYFIEWFYENVNYSWKTSCLQLRSGFAEILGRN
jgi:hypothetical protein